MEYVLEFDNEIPKNMCDMIIEKYNQSDNKIKGEIGQGYVNSDMKKTTDLIINSSDEWVDINKYLSRVIASNIFKYAKHVSQHIYKLRPRTLPHVFDPNITELTLPVIQCYDPHGYFKPHTDWSVDEKRILACIIYLNTMDDDQGGGTKFSDERIIKPTAGKILLFPATWTYVHEGCEVLKGKKYIVTCFLNVSRHL
jgi:hypothetical protein